MIEVLIVEDDLEIRKLLANFLSEKGMNITEAKDGDIAYDYIQDKSFDIILLDMMLPYKTGEELIKILRNNKSKDGNTYTPVIVISVAPLNTLITVDADALSEPGISTLLSSPTPNPSPSLSR